MWTDLKKTYVYRKEDAKYFETKLQNTPKTIRLINMYNVVDDQLIVLEPVNHHDSP